jgi:hypothetical protein
MTTKQKLTIGLISSVIVGAYATIFIYQRIQRAKADKSIMPAEEALKILRDKKKMEIHQFLNLRKKIAYHLFQIKILY